MPQRMIYHPMRKHLYINNIATKTFSLETPILAYARWSDVRSDQTINNTLQQK